MGGIGKQVGRKMVSEKFPGTIVGKDAQYQPILRLKILLKWGEGIQDGRVEGHGAHLLPQTHQKSIYIWNNSHRIPPESWQKISYGTKTTRKIPM